ncbi:MAG: ABC transporter substrate-binding protein [Lachnospiraceae bacterium]
MRKSIKKVLSLSLASVMTLSLAACGGGESNNEPASTAATEATEATTAAPAEAEGLAVNTTDPITISMSWWGGDSRHDATMKAVNKFMEKYPNITVEMQYAAWSGWEDKMSAAFSTNSAADVNQINWNWITSFSSDGSKFYDLNKLSDILDLTQFPESYLEDCSAAGKLQGVPISMTGRIFYWNKTTFEAAGLETPKTLADLMAAGPVFQDKLGDDYYPLVLNAFDRTILTVFYLESVYGKPWVENNVLQYSEEEVAEGMEFIQSLEDAHVIPSVKTIRSNGAETIDKDQKWMDGKYAGIFEWDSSANKFEGALNEGQEFVVGEELADMGDYNGGYAKVSMCFAISENTEYPAECAALINFLLNEEEGAEIMASERGIPVSAAGLAICEEKGLLNELVTEANKKVLEYVEFPLDQNFEAAALKAEPEGIYWDAFEGLSYGDYDVNEAAEVLVEGINEVLNKN